MHEIPFVRLEVEGLRRQIFQAIKMFHADQEEMINTALAQVCTPTYLNIVVSRMVKEEVEKAIREEVARFFQVGDGHKEIQVCIQTLLRRP